MFVHGQTVLTDVCTRKRENVTGKLTHLIALLKGPYTLLNSVYQTAILCAIAVCIQLQGLYRRAYNVVVYANNQ